MPPPPMPRPPMGSAGEHHMEGGQADKYAFNFSDATIRAGFIRKVFTLVTLMVSILWLWLIRFTFFHQVTSFFFLVGRFNSLTHIWRWALILICLILIHFFQFLNFEFSEFCDSARRGGCDDGHSVLPRGNPRQCPHQHGALLVVLVSFAFIVHIFHFLSCLFAFPYSDFCRWRTCLSVVRVEVGRVYLIYSLIAWRVGKISTSDTLG